ncbi:hypothetical protein, partial [Bacteroides acidifaciens]|uniref:hypothetical protein n=1 Tax=Bacteroides acidifaciens TaxID=85831 RepID=UPI0025A68496
MSTTKLWNKKIFSTIEMYPTLNPAEEQTPIAIEYAYFLEDGEQDPSKPNRYYFLGKPAFLYSFFLFENFF